MKKSKISALLTAVAMGVTTAVLVCSSGTVRADNSVSMYRLFNPATGEHLYTADANEKNVLSRRGWSYEGIGWFAPVSGAPVYRLFNLVTGEHLFTVDPNERAVLLSRTEMPWRDEGIGWYSDDAGRVPVYRLFSESSYPFSHHYTTSANERNVNMGEGWRDEGIGWYAVAEGRQESSGEQGGGAVEYHNSEHIYLDPSWLYANESVIHTGHSVMYRAPGARKNIVVALNAGHGTKGGTSVKTYCHPDHSEKVTGGSTKKGATKAAAITGGMYFVTGTPESFVTLQEAIILRDKLLNAGYDVLMVRDELEVQLDNVARAVICNNAADCHISLHWDGDTLDYDKGAYYCAVPDALKGMPPVAQVWIKSDTLGQSLINGLAGQGIGLWGRGVSQVDLTQTSYSTIPSATMELGNNHSDHSVEALTKIADGLLAGINAYFGY